MDNRINNPPSTRALFAARIRSEAAANGLLQRPDHAIDVELSHADKLEQATTAVLAPDRYRVGAGGEIVPDPTAHKLAMHCQDTIASPTYLTVEASRTRLELADQCRVLDTTLDLCDTIQAQNSAERMLAAQMALMHRLTMKAGARADEALERMEGGIDTRHREAYSVQANRMVNIAARGSAEFQNGMLTLQRARSGGKQSITVTHIQNTQVNEGGKAVVTSSPVGGGQGGAMLEGATNGNDQ